MRLCCGISGRLGRHRNWTETSPALAPVVLLACLQCDQRREAWPILEARRIVSCSHRIFVTLAVGRVRNGSGGSWCQAPSPSRTTKLLVLTLANTSAVLSAAAQPTIGPLHHSAQWATHAQDAQHTGVSPVASQGLAKVHWHVPVDLAPPADEIFVHYGSPVVTAKNTVIVPVKTGTSSFRVQAHDGATGKKVWTLSTAYQPPFAAFMPGLGATLSNGRLFVPDVAGRVLVRARPDKERAISAISIFMGARITSRIRRPTSRK